MNCNLILCLALCTSSSALAQQPAPARSSDWPRLRVTYYVDGNKEVDEIEFKGWAPDKDVVITGKWAQRKIFPVPGARSPDEPRGSSAYAYRRRSVPMRRVWEVVYVDAATQGKSHVIVDAAGLPQFSEQILGANDLIAFHHVPGHGWLQLRKAARAYRYFLQEQAEAETAPTTRSR